MTGKISWWDRDSLFGKEPGLTFHLSEGEEDLLFVDVETTGLLFHNDARIVEIGLSVWDSSGLKGRITSLINPETPIPPMYTRIHGIDDSMVEHSPTFFEFWKENGIQFQGKVVIAHNLSFDMGMINRELMRRDMAPLGNPGIDTVPILKSLLPREKNHKLSHLAKSLGVRHDSRHRAEDDVAALEQVLTIALDRSLETLRGPLGRDFSFWGGAPSHRYFRDSVIWCQKTGEPLTITLSERQDEMTASLRRRKIESPTCTTKRVGSLEDGPQLPWLWKDVRSVEINGEE
ncbi:MAG: 3'-5' exonuclease [Nitrospiraceae bacterium]|nr:3'-5' exonuclease [Nitrospiraceae bacterium]